jgi:hypothetical protein
MAKMETHEGAARKPALSFLSVVLWICATLVVVVVGYVAWRITRPEHFFNPINKFGHVRFLACDRDGQSRMCDWSASMVPDVFAIGEQRDEVLSRLAEAGYEDNGDGRYVLRGADTPAFPVCSTDFLVVVVFDDAGGLVSATSQGGGVCL